MRNKITRELAFDIFKHLYPEGWTPTNGRLDGGFAKAAMAISIELAEILLDNKLEDILAERKIEMLGGLAQSKMVGEER